MKTSETMECQAIYAWATKLDKEDLGGLPECYSGQDVYEINIGTKDAAYGGWYFPVRYFIDYDAEELSYEECEALFDWECECLADAGTMSHHGRIPESAVKVESHEEVLAWLKASETSIDHSGRKPSVSMLVDADPSFYDSWANSAIMAIESEG